MKNPARKGALGWVCLGVVALGAAAWPIRGQLSAMATGRVDTQARLRQVLLASREDPAQANMLATKNGGVMLETASVRVWLDQQTGQLIQLSRPKTFYTSHPYDPGRSHSLKSESEAKAAMNLFLKEASVEMEAFEFTQSQALEGEASRQVVMGFERKIFVARFEESKSDKRYVSAGLRKGTIVMDAATGLVLKYSSNAIPPAAPWEEVISEQRAVEIAQKVWRGSGANFDPRQVQAKAQYIRSGNSTKVLPEDRLVPGYYVTGYVNEESTQCMARIDARDGKILQHYCWNASQSRGE